MTPLEQHITETHGSKEAAAKALGISIQSIYNLIRSGAIVIDGRIYKPTKYKAK